MSKWKKIIADCGGTSVNWAFYAENGIVISLETESLHPKYALSKTKEEWQSVLAGLPDFSAVPLDFYSAGCGNEATASLMQSQLASLGFGAVSVFPDSLGACRACCGRNPGTVAILGTGSILLSYNGAAITNRSGGFGSWVGDEGSGFYFGRLLLQKYLDESSFPDVDQNAIQAFIGNRDEVLKQLSLPGAQQWISGLAKKVNSLSLIDLHRENIRLFLDKYLPEKAITRELHVVGSYGFYQKELLRECLEERGWTVGKALQSPLESLVNWYSAENK